MPINPANIICLLQLHFTGFEASEPSADDEHLYKEFADTIEKCIESSECNIEADQGLVFDEDDFINDEEEEDAEGLDDEEANTGKEQEEQLPIGSQESSSASEYNPSPLKKAKTVDDEYLQKALEYYRSSKKGTRSIQSVQKKFRKVASVQQLLNYEQKINKPTSRREIVLAIKKEMIRKFQDAICRHQIIKDKDLKRWAIQIKTNLCHNFEFKSSDTFILNFKRQYRIVSRKITKLITKKYSSEMSNIEEESKLFIESICKKIEEEKLTNDRIFNTDQSGFRKELHSGRTLAFRGCKSVESLVQSLSATTHSYTIQPVISKEGKLLSPMLICLQEADGKFPQKGIPQYSNLYPVAGKSAILTKSIALDWFENVFFPSSPANSLLIVDSWSGFKDKEAINQRSGGKQICLEILPPKTTAIAQPLDVYFFRQYKQFIRIFSDMVVNDNISIDLFQRENILKIQSLTHNQFSSPKFHNMIKYAWFAAGYTKERPPKFEVPADYCFKKCVAGECDWITDGNKCHDCSFIRCAHCDLVLCFKHFFICYHIHFDNV